jgi:hypothetical protein
MGVSAFGEKTDPLYFQDKVICEFAQSGECNGENGYMGGLCGHSVAHHPEVFGLRKCSDPKEVTCGEAQRRGLNRYRTCVPFVEPLDEELFEI